MSDFEKLPYIPRVVDTATATIAEDADSSDAIFVGDYALFGIVMPSTWTAADISFEVSLDGTTYQHMYDETGAEVSITPTAGTTLMFEADFASRFLGAKYVKIRSGVSGAFVNQAGARTLTIIGRGMT
jgi:hypothetical protein